MTENYKPMMMIAVPQLGDPNFFHSVVLMLSHNADGAFGLVINNPMDLTLGDFAKAQNWACHENLFALPAYSGGPVEQGRGWVLHRDISLAERQEVMTDLFVSVSQESLQALLQGGLENFRLCLGYAGWGPGQLEDEMKEGAWITTEVHAKYVLETKPEETWNKILSDMGVDPSRLALGTGLH